MEDRTPGTRILTINSGSSSIKFAVFSSDVRLEVAGQIEDVPGDSSSARFVGSEGEPLMEERLATESHEAAMRVIADWLAERYESGFPAIGYRIVHGGERFTEPQRITPALLDDVERLVPFAPNHLPAQLADVRLLGSLYPDAVHVACFDTAFHRSMPPVAQLYPLPEWTRSEGILRYGFHGLSYEYVWSVLDREPAPPGRTIVAHLGNGASMAAISRGRSIDTTMGFTPAGGLVMSTRSGDLDPGVLLYLLEHDRLSPSELAELVNKRSGLLGVSGSASDVEGLLSAEATDERAHMALELFCYVSKKFLGSLVAALGGLDTLVFTGGIGEHAPSVRARICSGLDFLGLIVDEKANAAGAEEISSSGSRVRVRVIKTDEELMIARHTRGVFRRVRGESDEQRLQTA